MKVHFIHGIRVRDPKQNIGRLLPYFEARGYETQLHDYGWRWVTARWYNDEVVAEIAPHIGAGDVVVGHSNGGCIAWLLAEAGVKYRGAVLINPALDRKARFAPQIDWINVYYNEGDSAVALSRLLLFHPWGAMGREGPSYESRRVLKRDCAPFLGHSVVIEQATHFGPMLADDVDWRLGRGIHQRSVVRQRQQLRVDGD